VFETRVRIWPRKLHRIPRQGIRKPSPSCAIVRASGREDRPVPITGESLGKSETSRPDESPHRGIGVLSMPKSSQMLPAVRRGASLDRASYEILSPMGPSDSASEAAPDTPAVSPDGVSAFIARVLDQLALSAWLPAAFLTASMAVLLEFRSAKSANLLRAVQALTAQPLQVLVVMIPLLVIATVVTQAFSFECIRILEGYWGSSRLTDFARRPMVWLHLRKRQSINNRLRREYRRAVRAAMPEMLMNGISFPVVKAIEARVSPGQPQPDLTDEQNEELRATDWRTWSDAWRLARIGNLTRGAERYPDAYLVMPTKLGNLLRATEHNLQNAGNDVQSFVHRRRDTVSARVRMQHDQFRTRLEMYCTLVLVNAFLLVMTPIILAGHISNSAFVVTFASFAVLCIVNYLAAIASAQGYCLILRQMDGIP
jgi:hypothetical protein